MSQSYGIGAQYSASAIERLEWRLNQIQQAIAGSGSSPAVESLLTDLLAAVQLIQGQTDTIELTSENISLNADEINLNTDQVETLLTTIDAHLVALQAQVGNTAALEARLIEVRDQVIASVATTNDLEGLTTAGNAKLDVLVSQTDGLETALANQAALTTAGNAKLDALVAQTDGVEGGLSAISASIDAGNTEVANVTAAAQAIQAQTDQLESLLTSLNAVSGNTLIEAANIGINTANLNSDLTAVRGLLSAIAAESALIQSATTPLESLLVDLNGLAATEGVDIALIQTATANLLTTLNAFQVGTINDLGTIQIFLSDQLTKLAQIYGSTSNSESYLNVLIGLNQQIYDQLKPLIYYQRNIYNTYDHNPGSELALPDDPAIRKRIIVNDSGYEIGPTVVDGECWIFGSYKDNGVSADDYDFVVLPGETQSIELPNIKTWLVCEAATGIAAEGKFAIVEYK